MSDIAKKARAAMKAKAQRLGADRPTEKVDSATWTPPELLNADVKTGMRPISRRQFKKGGKVVGDCSAPRADRKPRKSGGKAITADSLINRNQKEANEERPGIKHVGGMKKGGVASRKHREDGGAIERIKNPNPSPDYSPKTDPDYKPSGGPSQEDKDALAKKAGEAAAARKSGGRTKKMDGGIMSPAMAGAARAMARGQAIGNVPGGILASQPASSRLSRASGMGLKKGGKAEGHEDVAADKALIKKMVKPSARTGRKTGGGVFSGAGYPGKVPGVVPGGRTARATGGKTKGKTAINIVINAGKPGQDGMMPSPGLMGAPKGLPVPLPPSGAAGAAPPMPMPPGGAPMGAPPMPPPGGAPMPRKRGGRTYRSYKDMDAGSASGEGRLEKAEIASRKSRIAPQNY
jgi:hypothetical protein